MNGIKRLIDLELKRCAEFFPVVTILGPRQSGKTTLAKTFFSDYSYINLEDPEYFELAKNDINRRFNTRRLFFCIKPIIHKRGRASYRIDTYLKIDSCCR